MKTDNLLLMSELSVRRPSRRWPCESGLPLSALRALTMQGSIGNWRLFAMPAIFAALITLVGVVNGAGVSGGAEGVGRATTRSVVHAISAIVITDMIFVFLVTR